MNSHNVNPVKFAYLLVLALCSCAMDPRDGVTDLSGKWTYASGFESTALGGIRGGRVILLPHDFTGDAGMTGYTGWVTIQRELPESVRDLALQGAPLTLNLSKVSDVAVVFIDHAPVARAGRADPYEPGYYRSIFVDLPPGAVRNARFLTIALFSPGPTPLHINGPALEIGPSTAVHRRYMLGEIVLFSFLFFYLAVGIFHLLIYAAGRREQHYVYFGVFAILLGFYGFFYTQTCDVVFGSHVLLRAQLEHSLLFSLSPFLLLFIVDFFQQRVSRMAVLYGVLFGAMIGIRIFGNWSILLGSLRVWQVSVLPVIGYMVFFIGREAVRGHPDGKILFVGLVIWLLSIVNDILRGLRVLETPQFAVLAFFVFVSSIVIALANRFVRAFRASRELNEDLEAKVHERTVQLQASIDELVTANQLKENAEGAADRLVELISGTGVTRHAVQDRQLVYQSGLMRKVVDEIAEVAPVPRPVLIQGETGTGKELIARMIHQESGRSEEPFVALNCAAVPPSLWESEIFGHVRGAFTDARARSGKIEQAGKGSLFLDEIGEMPVEIQAKLLRVLQEKVFEPVGAEKPIQADCRFLFATNRSLAQMVESGTFREDLFYRMSGLTVQIPALRDRPADIEPLINHYTHQFAAELNVPAIEMTQGALELLKAYSWPGNIRELENLMIRLLSRRERSPVRPDDLPPVFRAVRRRKHVTLPVGIRRLGFEAEMRRHARDVIVRALRDAGGRKNEAALALGIRRGRLFYQIRELDIQEQEYSPGTSDSSDAS